MNLIKNKKLMYILFVSVITLLSAIIIPTLAKFPDSYITNEEIVKLDLNYNINISNIEEYQLITIPANTKETFNIEISNTSETTNYYGIWYKLINQEKLKKEEEFIIEKTKDSTTPTIGEIQKNSTITASITIKNNTTSEQKIHIGITNSKTNNITDLNNSNEKKLITDEISIE